MLHIAVCDDEIKEIERLVNAIEGFGIKNNVSFNIHKYNDGEELINSNFKFDLIFLDIEMEVLGGIEAAQKIRLFDMNVPIVYVTSYIKYCRRAYKVHAFDFISKPFYNSDIHSVLCDFLITKKEAVIKKGSFTTENGIIILNTNDICYCLIKERKMVQVSTVYSEYIVKENLSDIFEKIDSGEFYLTNKSCIVNLKYVETILKDNGILMTDGTWLPLAIKKQKEFFTLLSKQLRKE